MHMGTRARWALSLGALLTAGAVLTLGLLGHWPAAAVALALGVSSLVALAGVALWRAFAREVDRLVTKIAADERRFKGLVGTTEKLVKKQRHAARLNRKSLARIEHLAAQQAQLATRVSFPALARPLPGDPDPVSTRFADYLESPVLRENDRMMALLETLAREATERRAFEDSVLERLSALTETATGRSDTSDRR